MRNYARFTTSMYRDGDFRALTVAQQGIYFLLSLQPEMSAAGTLSLTLRRWAGMADDLTPDALRAELKVIEARGHIVVDDDTEELLITKFVKWDGGIGNEKRRPVIQEAGCGIASQPIRHALAHEMQHLGYADMASLVSPSPGYPQPDAASDVQSGFDRSVVKEGDQIPHSATRTPHSHSALSGEPSEAACRFLDDASAGAPSMFCTKHPQGTEEACGPCGGARKRYAAWAQAKTDGELEARRAAAEARDACQLCDERGMRLDPKTRLPTGRCDHGPAAS